MYENFLERQEELSRLRNGSQTSGKNSGSLRFGRRDTRYTLKIYHLVWGALRRNAETAVAMLDGTTPSKIRAHVHTQAHIHT